MALVSTTNNSVTVLMVAVLLALAFAGGYYYYRQKDKDTILDVNIGGTVWRICNWSQQPLKVMKSEDN